MASLKYTNGGQSTLASNYTAGDSSIHVASGEGARFPASGDYWLAVDDPPAFWLRVTARSSDTLTVDTTGADGSTAVSKAAGTKITQVLPAAAIDQMKRDIVGYANLIDFPPASPDAMDDEFDAGSLDAKWTELNTPSSGSPAHSLSESKLILTVGTAGTRGWAFVQNAPVGNWRFRAKLSIEGWAGNYIALGLCARRITGDKTGWGGILWNGGWVGWGGYLSPLSTLIQDFSGTGVPVTFPWYQEIEYDGTNIIFRISTTGSVFRLQYSVTVASYLGAAPDQVGILAHVQSTYEPAYLCDWFRRVA
jgi:hypothetical protein